MYLVYIIISYFPYFTVLVSLAIVNIVKRLYELNLLSWANKVGIISNLGFLVVAIYISIHYFHEFYGAGSAMTLVAIAKTENRWNFMNDSNKVFVGQIFCRWIKWTEELWKWKRDVVSETWSGRVVVIICLLSRWTKRRQIMYGLLILAWGDTNYINGCRCGFRWCSDLNCQYEY